MWVVIKPSPSWRQAKPPSHWLDISRSSSGDPCISPNRCVSQLGEMRLGLNVIQAFMSSNLVSYTADCLSSKSMLCCVQVSTRNRILILFDWVKTRIFGRDLSIY